MNTVVNVSLWGTTIGYLGYEPGQTQIASFEFDRDFIQSNIQISPAVMKYPPSVHRFDAISMKTFKGLPGIFADSLPDSWGNKLIDMYFAQKGIPSADITSLDRLLYVGKRGMGAFEYEPAKEFDKKDKNLIQLDIGKLSELVSLVLERDETRRKELLTAQTMSDALYLIKTGSSAGGARSKALVALDTEGKIYDGTVLNNDTGNISSFWILKFDTDGNKDRDRRDPEGMTKVEYCYSLIAKKCGIAVPEVRYLSDGKSFHFLIERFDRKIEEGKIKKIHFNSWAALAHADRDQTGIHSYEQLILLARTLGLGDNEVQEIFTRAVFNILGRNQDDHTKNFAFIMERDGSWKLSPAFDLTWSYDPEGKWTRSHQIRLNGKQDEFTRDDLLEFGKYCNLTEKKALRIIGEVKDAFLSFPALCREFEVPRELEKRILETQRLEI